MPYFSGPREARRFSELVPIPKERRKFWNSKLFGRSIAEELGIKVPQELAQFDNLAAVDLSALPEHFVLKANAMSSRRGIYILRRTGGDAYFDTFSQRIYSTAEIRADIVRALTALRRAPDTPVLAEEFVIGANGADQIPFDYKLYVFDGQVELAEQIDRNVKPLGLAFFGRDFVPLERHHTILAPEFQFIAPTRPDNWEDLIGAARKISLRLDVPFISVDLYTNGREVIFGELTPTPGGPYFGAWRFSDEIDYEFGAYYRRGYRRRGETVPMVDGLPPVLRKHARELAARERKERRRQQHELRRLTSPGIKASAKLLVKAIRRRLTRFRGSARPALKA